MLLQGVPPSGCGAGVWAEHICIRMPHWSFSKVTTGTGAMAASATISVTTCACHLNSTRNGRTQNRQPKDYRPFPKYARSDLPHPTPNHLAMRTKLFVLPIHSLRIAAWPSGHYVMMPIDRADRHDPAPFGRNEGTGSFTQSPKSGVEDSAQSGINS